MSNQTELSSTEARPQGAFINYERGGGGMGDLRGDLKIFYTEKGGDLKCFQNTEVKT